MKKRLTKRVILALALSCVIGASTPALAASGSPSPAAPRHYLSADVPLGSYVYAYLEKLDGLGYLPDMRPGARPYTRMQVAKWVLKMQAEAKQYADVPGYATAMLDELAAEFAPELALLNGAPVDNGLKLREWTLEETYYKGDALPQHATKSTYQPLNINNNGYRLSRHANEILSAQIEGNLGRRLVVSVTPRFSYDDKNGGDASLEAGYVKTGWGNTEILVGKDPLWWGQGSRGSLSLTNNASPLTMIRLSSIDPVHLHGMFKFLGEMRSTFFYGELEHDRSDVPYPSFVGFRKDFTPNENLTFGLARTSIVGGKGHMLSGGDYWMFIPGTNATSAKDDKSDSIAGGDFRWRLPGLRGMQLYGEVYGEDQADGIIPLPSQLAEVAGLYIPRLTPDGDWDLRLEWGHTTDWWYGHWVYTDGYTYKGDILGDAVGHDADRYYAQATRYLPGFQVSLNAERVKMDLAAAEPQTVDSLWLEARKNLGHDLSVKATLGVADVKNAGYVAGHNQHDYLAGVSLTQRY